MVKREGYKCLNCGNTDDFKSYNTTTESINGRGEVMKVIYKDTESVECDCGNKAVSWEIYEHMPEED